MAAGMLPPCDIAAGTCRRGVWRQVYISRNFWFDHLFFENQRIFFCIIRVHFIRAELLARPATMFFIWMDLGLINLLGPEGFLRALTLEPTLTPYIS
jgi:hypothetical protein